MKILSKCTVNGVQHTTCRCRFDSPGKSGNFVSRLCKFLRLNSFATFSESRTELKRRMVAEASGFVAFRNSNGHSYHLGNIPARQLGGHEPCLGRVCRKPLRSKWSACVQLSRIASPVLAHVIIPSHLMVR